MGNIDQFEEGGQYILAHPLPALDHRRTDDLLLIVSDRLNQLSVSCG
jgi:hypothetical protein